MSEVLDSEQNALIFWLEIAILIIIVVGQLFLSIKIYRKIQELKNIFKEGLFIRNRFIDKKELYTIINEAEALAIDELGETSKEEATGDDIIKLSLVDTRAKTTIINRIKNGVNTYLINNYGAAVNFSIIKDIIDREVDIKDEEIAQSISVPLYLGLAATMFGIVLGLWSMPSLEGENFSDAINALIKGVQYAMLASLSGLMFTTLLSSQVYKKAKSQTLNAKNSQLSYLQAKLLPELIRAEDTGVSGLKASLDRFARVATDISDNVYLASNQTGENLVLQQEVIEKIENMKVLKVSKWNLELFEKLENNMEALSMLSKYLTQMAEISSNLSEFSKRTSEIDQIIRNIDITLTQSNRLTTFLTNHFDKIEASGSAALKAVGLAEVQFEDAIETLRERTDSMINQLAASSGNHEIKLEEIYKRIDANLNQITKEYISSFSQAYSGAVPKFEQLDNLNLLPGIKSDSNVGIQKLISGINEVNKSLESLKRDLNNSAPRSSPRTINDEHNNRSKEKPSAHSNSVSQSEATSKKQSHKPISIGVVIKNLFTRARSDD